MTIQNIEDVMERIMSLNRNLTEESLKTLLSASGWDREDILEGLRIFRASNKNTVTTTPISSQFVDLNKVVADQRDIEEKVQEADNVEKPYTFSLKKREDLAPAISAETETETELIPAPPQDKKSGEVESFMNGGGDFSSDSKNRFDSANSVSPAVIPLPSDTDTKIITSKKKDIPKDKKKNRLGFIIFLFALLLLLGLSLVYLSLPSFTKWVDENILGISQPLIVKNVPKIDLNSIQNVNPSVTNLNSNNDTVVSQPQREQLDERGDIIVDSSTSTVVAVSPEIMSDVQIRALRAEIEELKSQIAGYKNSVGTGETKTIVKYISQKGPAGSAGRGILSVGATTTGFVINYTDNTSEIVSYSTSTLIDVLNSKQVCFRDVNATTSSSTDACLDKETVINLLNK